MKKKRIDTNPEPDAPLTDNPFAAAPGRMPENLPEGESSPQSGAADHGPGRAWSVEKTRKGGWPVRFEKRTGNKAVTIIDRVSGDAKALLTALKKHCGAGGTVREGSIELQGDHRERVQAFLDTTAHT
ncbi:MAG: translation initiation factor [Candidatus Hydrogenedentota bacterium]